MQLVINDVSKKYLEKVEIYAVTILKVAYNKL